jgi:hypothetical protein
MAWQLILHGLGWFGLRYLSFEASLLFFSLASQLPNLKEMRGSHSPIAQSPPHPTNALSKSYQSVNQTLANNLLRDVTMIIMWQKWLMTVSRKRVAVDQDAFEFYDT